MLWRTASTDPEQSGPQPSEHNQAEKKSPQCTAEPSEPTANKTVDQLPRNTELVKVTATRSLWSSLFDSMEANRSQSVTTPEIVSQPTNSWASWFKRDEPVKEITPSQEEPGSDSHKLIKVSVPSADNNPSSWGFWSRKSVKGGEEGELAVSGTETETRPRDVQLPVPKRQKQVPSLVIPDFDTSIPWPSRKEKLSHLFGKSSSHITRSCPQWTRRAIVIGVHGYFPAKVTRAILGEPTGTSIKFANEAEKILKRWHEKNFETADLHVDKIALEGEGKIGHRIDKLYELLINWREVIANADFIFFAVHSQGAVVTLSMVARLLEQGIIAPLKQRLTVMCMAGSLLGPMHGMDQTLIMKAITRIEHDSLFELFELQRPTTDVSALQRQALSQVLKAGVKLVLVGSADDQLIPLYSALAIHVNHPNIFRAVYLDGEDVKPEVITPLLQLATRQLNAGRTDDGVITELSSVLAGALTSKGHSKLYSNDSVYDLGVRVSLESYGSFGIEPTFNYPFKKIKVPKALAPPAKDRSSKDTTKDHSKDHKHNTTISHGPSLNPYMLPWAAQALISESRNNVQLQPYINELLHQFPAWRPETKPLKDLKWRLNGISNLSKL